MPRPIARISAPARKKICRRSSEIIRIDGKSIILADRLLAALEKRATTAVVASEPTEMDELARARREIARAG